MRTVLLCCAIVVTVGRPCNEVDSDATCEASLQSATGERSLLQRATRRSSNSRAVVHEVSHSQRVDHRGGVRAVIDVLKGLSWTTNIGQQFHSCKGSKFDVEVSGDYSGLVIDKGILLKKGSCQHASSSTVPLYTQQLSCKDDATGCHMWCAPVWTSHRDTTDWGAFDERCRTWNGSFGPSDAACEKADHLFTWARTDVPAGKNTLDLTFAIATGCNHWCSPLWVTVYDENDFAKSWRWCFNRKDDWGGCDSQEDVAPGSWHDRSFKLTQFVQKHGYSADSMILELAVYADFNAAPETLINRIKFRKVPEVATTTPEPPRSPGEKKHKAKIENCGTEPCKRDEMCCRKGNSTVDTKCCPTDWQCCEDSCCPSYFVCTISSGKHSCDAPIEEPPKKPDLCKL